jgi:hypothetical protein
MKRLFWLSVGAGAGIYASHRVRRRVERLARTWSPEGVANRAITAGHNVGQRLRHFADDVRTEMRAREAELREAVKIDQAPPELESPRRRRVLKTRYTIVNAGGTEGRASGEAEGLQAAMNTDDDKDGH